MLLGNVVSSAETKRKPVCTGIVGKRTTQSSIAIADSLRLQWTQTLNLQDGLLYLCST